MTPARLIDIGPMEPGLRSQGFGHELEPCNRAQSEHVGAPELADPERVRTLARFTLEPRIRR